MKPIFNKTGDYQFTIVVPMYNEEESIGHLTSTLAAYLPKAKYKSCVLFVNDGSKDGTLALLEKACAANDDF